MPIYILFVSNIRFHPTKRVSMFITDPWYENPLDVEIADLFVVDKTCNYRLPDWSAGRDYSKRLLNDLNESNSKGKDWILKFLYQQT